MSPSGPILILADDLSGAAELAGIAFARGLSAEVHRNFDPSSSAQLIAIDTDSRSLPADQAAARVTALVEQIKLLRPAWLYKKLDSILRGNVRAELEALLQATGLPRALLLPANPSRGRIISAGRYYIDGQPLHETSFAADPHHPRHTASVLSLLGPDGNFPVHTMPATARLPSHGIIVPDTTSHAELSHLAAADSTNSLLAGAADFFTALLLIRSHPSHPSHPCSVALPPPALLVCGSRVSWPARFADCTRARVAIATIDKKDPPLSQDGALLLGIGDNPSIDQSTLLLRLADSAAKLISKTAPNTLLVEGGATAAALAAAMKWPRFSVVATAPSGVGVLRPLAPASPLVLIKPGSYPWPPEIWNDFCRLARN